MAKKTDSAAQPSSRFFSILVLGGSMSWYTGKTTLIQTISHATGCVLPMQTQGSAIGGVFGGRVNLDEDHTLLLVEARHIFDLFDLPGEIIGAAVVVNSSHPEFLRDSLSQYLTLRAYMWNINLPLVVVDNPHIYWHERENTGDDLYSPETAWDIEALHWTLKLDDDVPIVQGNLKNREVVKAALVALLEHAEKTFPAELYDVLPYTPVYTVPELFPPGHQHRWLYVINADWANIAHWFMDTLADEIVWLSPDSSHFPVRLGRCSLDAQSMLYMVAVDELGGGGNLVQPAVQRLRQQLAEQEPNPAPIRTGMQFNDGTIGYVLIVNSLNPVTVARTQVLMEETLSSVPVVLVDRPSQTISPDGSPSVSAADRLPPHVPLLRADKFDKPAMYEVMRLLAELLPAELAAKFKQKFAAENP